MPSRQRLSLCEAAALGALQGPTELLPVSSSGHTSLIPWLADWPYAELEPELRKSFEVALHAGAGVALAIDMRGELIEAALRLDRRGAVVVALSLAPPAIAGYVLERPIERRLGGPRSIAVGLIAGAVAMTFADIHPGRGEDSTPHGATAGNAVPESSVQKDAARTSRARGTRRRQDAGPRDGLALGLAQAAALVPGVSRNGATLTAARARGFAREDAQILSWHAALPVILGAVALKGARLLRPGAGAHDARTYGANLSHDTRGSLAMGGASAFLSTLASAHVLRRPRVSARALLPYAVYRCMIAAIAIMRLRRTQNRSE